MDFWQELLLQFGFGAVVLLAIIGILKNYINKVLSKSIDEVIDKTIAKYTSELNKVEAGYRIKLEKEMAFLEYLSYFESEYLMIACEAQLYMEKVACVDEQLKTHFDTIAKLITDYLKRIKTSSIYTTDEVNGSVKHAKDKIIIFNDYLKAKKGVTLMADIKADYDNALVEAGLALRDMKAAIRNRIEQLT